MELQEKIEVTLLINREEIPGGVEYTYTSVGNSLTMLSTMWNMPITDVIEKIANEAPMHEEENIVDGRYVAPDWAVQRVLH